MEGNNVKTIKSYSGVWELKREFYGFPGWASPQPISWNAAIYALFSAVLIKLLPLAFLPAIMRYLLIPLGIGWLLDQKMIDDKNPVQFIRSMFMHYFLIVYKGSIINRYNHKKYKNIFIKQIISYRTHTALK